MLIDRAVDPRMRLLTMIGVWQLLMLVLGCAFGRVCVSTSREFPNSWPWVGSGFFGWFALFLGKRGIILFLLPLVWIVACLLVAKSPAKALRYWTCVALGVALAGFLTMGLLGALSTLFSGFSR